MLPQIIIDDASPVLRYSGTQWALNKGAVSAFNQTVTVCNADNTTSIVRPQVSFLFYGSELALYGPQNGDNVNVSYIIDGSSRRPAQLLKSSTPSQSGLKLWSLENMDTQYHDITFFPDNGTFSFDFFSITPNKYSTLTGQQLVLDDGDSQIRYSAGWAAPNNGTMESVLTQGRPFGGNFMGTNTANANMTFNFTGSSVSVYGLLNQQAGRLSFSYSVDNSAPQTMTPFDGTQSANNAWRLNQEFFHQDLGPGMHSVTLQALEITGSQTLWVDYVAFEGSSATTISPSASPTTTASSSRSDSPLSASQIGGVVVVALVLFFMCCFGEKCLQYSRRRRGRYTDPEGDSSTTYQSGTRDNHVVFVASNQANVFITNNNSNRTSPYNTSHSHSQPLPAYHPQTMPHRDAGPAEAPPPYNPNSYTP